MFRLIGKLVVSVCLLAPAVLLSVGCEAPAPPEAQQISPPKPLVAVAPEIQPIPQAEDQTIALPPLVTGYEVVPGGVLMGDKLTTEALELYRGQPGIVRMGWKTDSEENVLGFDIRRSKTRDGEYEVVNDKIILGAGNSSIPHRYRCYDLDVLIGEVFYYYVEEIGTDNVRAKSSPTYGVHVTRLNLTPGAKVDRSQGQDEATSSTQAVESDVQD